MRSVLFGIRPCDAGKYLAGILADSPLPLTAVLSDLAGCDLALRVLSTGWRDLTDAEAHRLGTGPGRCRYRYGQLVTPAGAVAAAVSLAWLPRRLPWGAAAGLERAAEPAGIILARYGMTREDRRAMATWGIEDVTGQGAACRSSAVLVVSGTPAGIAEEHVTRRFAESLAAPR